ncbi:unnamed protein product, partial [marine sediment metagenome]
MKLRRVQVICPACRQQVEAVATDGQVKGYCAVANRYVDFVIETQLAPQNVVRIRKPPTAETRAKISATLMGKPHPGKPHTPETRAKMSAAHSGKRLTPEHRTKISAAILRLTAETKAKMSHIKPHTPETKAKMSA